MKRAHAPLGHVAENYFLNFFLSLFFFMLSVYNRGNFVNTFLLIRLSGEVATTRRSLAYLMANRVFCCRQL